MSRDFSKNVANYMSVANADVTLINGCASISFAFWAKLDTISAGTQNNILFDVPVATGFAGFKANINGSTSALRVHGRATAAETLRSSAHSIATSTGVWHHYAGTVDFANDLIYTAMDGALENHSTTGWTATTFSAGTSVGTFRIGQACVASGSLVAAEATDGLIADFAIWRNYILSAADVMVLNDGVRPWKVAPASLLLWRTLEGLDANETDLISHNTVTITGSIPAGASEAPTQLFSDAVIPFDPSWMEPSLTTIAPQAWGNIMRQMAS